MDTQCKSCKFLLKCPIIEQGNKRTNCALYTNKLLTISIPCPVGSIVYLITTEKKKRKKIRYKIVVGTIDHFAVGYSGVPVADICDSDNNWYIACSSNEYFLSESQAQIELERILKRIESNQKEES